MSLLFIIYKNETSPGWLLSETPSSTSPSFSISQTPSSTSPPFLHLPDSLLHIPTFSPSPKPRLSMWLPCSRLCNGSLVPSAGISPSSLTCSQSLTPSSLQHSRGLDGLSFPLHTFVSVREAPSGSSDLPLRLFRAVSLSHFLLPGPPWPSEPDPILFPAASPWSSRPSMTSANQ